MVIFHSYVSLPEGRPSEPKDRCQTKHLDLSSGHLDLSAVSQTYWEILKKVVQFSWGFPKNWGNILVKKIIYIYNKIESPLNQKSTLFETALGLAMSEAKTMIRWFVIVF